ncbi:PIG-L family deacetylase [Oscillochloris sp. ZM17-4]|uniref:PIG-L deacetylase family protein n=1 Tax=Oscillochloris sp. ZM17-4 TaxID=2866714 RepID=UPI001C73719E|nr:PIG-L deacetylase family protein [Oscillochloris sp. ZM17-4]MBX0330595.1 PIG-L family deacetylase [Oscillochloris sp. ZM17-4]
MTQDTPTSPIRILVIVAHPDDIEFGMGGSVARWTDEGHQVIYAMITDGSAGTNEPGADLAALARTRRSEQIAAATIVGVHDVRFLGYRDGTLQPTLDLRRDLTRLIRELRPDRVVCQDPTLIFAGSGYINHPDHRAAGEAAMYAVFPSAETRPIFPELLSEGLEPHKVRELYLTFSPQPDLFIDTSAVIDRKIESLLCHRSQVGPEVGDMVRGWDAETAKDHGYAYAESFRVMRLVDN